MQQIYDYFDGRFSKYRIGIKVVVSEFYLGTAHLLTSELELLNLIPSL